jgi:PAS domain S-box-containing protein
VTRDITWRKRAEEELSKREREFRMLADNVPAYFLYMDKDLRIRFANKRHEELFDINTEQTVGMHMKDLIGNETFECFESYLETALSGREVSFEVNLPHFPGGPRWTEGNIIPDVINGETVGLFALANDITDRKRAEEKLKDSEERYRTFVTQITEGIWRCELEKPCPTDLPEEEQAVHILEHSVMAECNDTLAHLYGFSEAKELTGEHINAFVQSEPEIIESLCDFVRSNYRIAHVETKEQDREGHQKHFSNSRVGIVEGNHLVRVWGTTRDITEMKRAEEEVLTSRERLRALTMQLSAVEEQERRRFATYLHDQIGQSLAVVQMRLGTLSAASNLQASAQNIQGARNLLDEIIENTRTLTFDLSPPVLYELGLGAAVEWIGEKISKEHGLGFEFQDDGRAKPMKADIAALLFRGARELLINVAKHARASSVKATVGRDDGSVFVTIQDDGVGFDTSLLDPRADENQFGLFSIRERMNYIGGRLEIHSEPDRGTHSTLIVPYQPNFAP